MAVSPLPNGAGNRETLTIFRIQWSIAPLNLSTESSLGVTATAHTRTCYSQSSGSTSRRRGSACTVWCNLASTRCGLSSSSLSSLSLLPNKLFLLHKESIQDHVDNKTLKQRESMSVIYSLYMYAVTSAHCASMSCCDNGTVKVVVMVICR